MLVLLAEDDTGLAELIIEYLDDEQIECDIAYNGAMALNLLEQQNEAFPWVATAWAGLRSTGLVTGSLL